MCGKRYKSPINWFELGERRLVGPDNVQDAQIKVHVIRDRILAGQSQQKSYAYSKRGEPRCGVGDHVCLRVSPMKGVMWFGKKGKFSVRSISPFEILERVGNVAYKLALTPMLTSVIHFFTSRCFENI